MDKQPAMPSYTSRLLTCSMCYRTQETWWMQLRTTNGFRSIHCKYCKYQEYTARTKCQCGVRWHHCQVHRVDPLVHASKRGRMKPKGGNRARGKKIVSIKSSLKAAPILVGGATKPGRGVRMKTLRKSRLTSHAAINRTPYSPKEAMIQRIRDKAAEKARRRIMEDEVSEAAKTDEGHQEHAVRHGSITVESNPKTLTGTHASASTARKDLKEAVLGMICTTKNSPNSVCIKSSRNRQVAGTSARNRGQGMGDDHRRLATASLPERAASLRLLAS